MSVCDSLTRCSQARQEANDSLVLLLKVSIAVFSLHERRLSSPYSRRKLQSIRPTVSALNSCFVTLWYRSWITATLLQVRTKNLPLDRGTWPQRRYSSSFNQDHMRTNALFSGSSNRASLPPSPSASVSAAIYPNPLFAIRPVPGKGLGLIANRSISAGTLIHSEAPLIHLDNSEVGYYRLEWEIQRLYPFEQAIYKSFHHTGMDELPSILEIWHKNSFPSGDNAQAAYSTISRLNNSCTPNAFLSWDFSRKIMNLFAVRDINSGEEICVSYVNTLLERNMRHEIMQEIWEFSCRCEACELKGEELEKSNERRWKVKRAIQELGESDISLQDVLFQVSNI